MQQLLHATGHSTLPIRTRVLGSATVRPASQSSILGVRTSAPTYSQGPQQEQWLLTQTGTTTFVDSSWDRPAIDNQLMRSLILQQRTTAYHP